MTDLIELERERTAWLPAQDAELVQTIHYYDRPLVGVVKQGGMDHLFWCFAGQVDKHSAWAYVRLEPRDLVTLSAATAENLPETLESLVSGQLVVLAVSDEDSKIRYSGFFGPADSSVDLFRALVAELHELREADADFTSQLSATS